MSKPEAIGLSSERLARIPAFLEERYIRTGRLPCAQVQVWRRGKLAVNEVLGLADRLSREGKAVAVSAWTGEGIEPLRETIAGLIDDDPETELTLLPSQGEALAWLYENGRVTGRETDDEGRTHVVVRLHPAALGRFERQFG